MVSPVGPSRTRRPCSARKPREPNPETFDAKARIRSRRCGRVTTLHRYSDSGARSFEHLRPRLPTRSGSAWCWAPGGFRSPIPLRDSSGFAPDSLCVETTIYCASTEDRTQDRRFHADAQVAANSGQRYPRRATTRCVGRRCRHWRCSTRLNAWGGNGNLLVCGRAVKAAKVASRGGATSALSLRCANSAMGEPSVRLAAHGCTHMPVPARPYAGLLTRGCGVSFGRLL